MSDALDALMRAQTPAVDLSPQRVERVIGAVLQRLPPQPASTPWGDLLTALALLPLPLPRLGLVLAAAAVLGLVVGSSLKGGPAPADLTELIASTTAFPMGS